MTKKKTLNGAPDPFKPVTDIDFSYRHFFHYRGSEDASRQIAVATAKSIIRSGRSDELRQLYLCATRLNDWDSNSFYNLVQVAVLLHDYYSSIADYPIPKRFQDAVLNAVEHDYVSWIRFFIIHRIKHSRQEISLLEQSFNQHVEILQRANFWFFQNNREYLHNVPQPLQSLPARPIKRSATIPWMKTNLVSPACSAPLPEFTLPLLPPLSASFAVKPI